MEPISNQHFGLLIAYLIPGFITINGVAYHSEVVAAWIGESDVHHELSVGGFLYTTIASVFAGLIASTIRWMLMDWLLHATGVTKPNWDFSELSRNQSAYQLLNEIHYKYYQFYGNSLVAICFYAVTKWLGTGLDWFEILLCVSLAGILFAGARDTLTKHCHRVEQLLSSTK